MSKISTQATLGRRALTLVVASAALVLGVSASTMAADLSGSMKDTDGPPVQNQEPAIPGHYVIGGFDVTVSGALTMGTAIRSSAQNPYLTSFTNGGKAPGGQNSDDGDLNYKEGDAVSSPFKGFVSIDANRDGFGAFVRTKFWYDPTLEDSPVPHGNLVNGYKPNTPLSDATFDNAAKFSGIALGEAYAYGKVDGPIPVEGRIGNIVVPWGLTTMIPGGLITAVNGVDFNSLNRPAALPEEIFQPTPGALIKFGVTDKLTLQAMLLFQGPQNQVVGCGTFYSLADYAAPGCNEVVFLNPKADGIALATPGGYISRAATPSNDDPQFGFGSTYQSDALNTLFGVYFAHLDSPKLNYSIIKNEPNGALPGGSVGPFGLYSCASVSSAKFLCPAAYVNQYFGEYAPGVDTISANFQTKLPSSGTTLYGEYMYQPNAPLQISPLDLLYAGLGSPLSLASLIKQYQALPVGGVMQGYDLHQVGNLTFGAKQPIPGAIPESLGASVLVLGGEAALKEVYDLPDPADRRYGRSDLFGQGVTNNPALLAFPWSTLGTKACNVPGGAPAATPKNCSLDGYVSDIAWGYRLKASLVYDNVFVPGLQVTPSVGLTHDVEGWSYDGVISQGRIIANLGVHFDYNKIYFADLTWSPALAIGPYDQASDRQLVTISGGVRF